MKGSRGFTLLELLVAIAIILILAALLLPVISRAREKGKAVGCLNNLKKWGVATFLFAAENRDLLPQDGSPLGNSVEHGWYNDLPAMLGIPVYRQMPWGTNAAIDVGHSIWICPSNTRRSNGGRLFHYCLNENVNGTSVRNAQISLSSLLKPSLIVWLFDNGGIAAVARQNNVHSNLHSAGAQFVFVDGHAARFRNVEYWDFTVNRGRTNNPSLIWVPF